MSGFMNLNLHELMLRDRVISALNSSLSLPAILEAARAPLLELTPADSVALCLMRLTPSLDFTWLAPGHRLPLLEEYADVAEHDFLRGPILARPGVVVRDTQVLTRGELERSIIHQRSRDLGMPLENIAAVLLPIRPGFVGALAIYRNRRHAFSDQSAAIITSLTDHLVNAVRNCSDVKSMATGNLLLEELHGRADTAFLIVEPPHREVMRSRHAAVLLERWFKPSELHSSGLPFPLKEQLDTLVRMSPDARLEKNVWVSLDADAYRVVRFIEMPAPEGPRQWALVMNEIPISIPLPLEMKRKLSSREIAVAMHMLRNWSYEEIAKELGITLLTVKTHARNIFDKLGVDSRTDFLYQAARLNKPV
jgi:DNA-binding CsgD family transcriptional regulator